MTSRCTRRFAHGSPGLAAPLTLGVLVALVALVAAGCASSDPYWSREDRNSAESIAAAEAAARAAGQQGQLAPIDERNAAPVAQPTAPESEPPASQDTSGTAPQASELPEGITAEPLEDPATEPAVAGNRIEQSDLEMDEPQDPGTQPAPENAPADTTEPSAGHYETSLELLEQGRFSEAEEGFRRFLAENPDSDLADNAQFWLAESALRQSDPATALAGFRAVVENYPEANKVPDALLKVGYCLAALGEPESAATVYRELVERFPESAAAETARVRLATP